MLKPMSGLLIALALLVACSPPVATPSPAAITPLPSPTLPTPTPEAAAQAFASDLMPAWRTTLPSLEGATFYDLDWNLHDDLQTLDGLARVDYTNREGILLHEIQFRLFPNILGGSLTIEQILRDGLEATSALEMKGSLLRVMLDPPLRSEQMTRIEIRYRLRIPSESTANYGILASTQDTIMLSHAYPHIPVYDQGWNAEIPSDQGDLTHADAAFYLVHVKTPAGLQLASSGIEISRQPEGEQQVVTLAAGPARDFYLTAGKDWQTLSRQANGITIKSHAPPHLEESSRQALEAAAQALQVFNRLYGPYPYSELDVTAAPIYALGVEYPGIIVISLDLYGSASKEQGNTSSAYLESTVVHETAHQWFYNLIGNDQADEPWLDEALAQYATWQYYHQIYGQTGADEFERSLRNRWALVDNRTIPIGQPVASYRGGEYSAIIYGRGPLFVAALANAMGQETFDTFMLEYVKGLAWEISTTSRFKTAAESACRCDLTPLFKEWVYTQP